MSERIQGIRSDHAKHYPSQEKQQAVFPDLDDAWHGAERIHCLRPSLGSSYAQKSVWAFAHTPFLRFMIKSCKVLIQP